MRCSWWGEGDALARLCQGMLYLDLAEGNCVEHPQGLISLRVLRHGQCLGGSSVLELGDNIRAFLTHFLCGNTWFGFLPSIILTQ